MKSLALTLVVLFGACSGLALATAESATAPAPQTEEDIIAVEAVEEAPEQKALRTVGSSDEEAIVVESEGETSESLE